MKTQFLNPTKIKRSWHVIDAKGKVLGRVASEAAALLRGKFNTSFNPSHDTGDYVIVINTGKIELTGKKWADKIYYHHTGYVGGIKDISAEKLHAKKPTAIIEKAIQGMLPKGPLGRAMLQKLFAYAGAEHPHSAQQPKARTFAS